MTFFSNDDPRLKSLKKNFAAIAKGHQLAVAYSGGIDSRFLAFSAVKLGFSPLLFHVTGPHIPSQETVYAKKWAKDQNLPLSLIPANILNVPDIMLGTKSRCYHCKFILFTIMREQAGDLVLCDGSQASDAANYRPGRKALEELCVYSPLALSGIDKPSVRELGALLGMDNTDQKARPCLLTRLAYGITPDLCLLKGIALAEEAISIITKHRENFDFRLRVINTECIELHMPQHSFSQLPFELQEEITREVAIHLPQFPYFKLRGLEKISGYFDRKEGLVP